MKRMMMLLLLCPVLFATVCNFSPQDAAAQEAFDTAMGFVAVAILLSVVIISLSYMIGSATSNPRLLVFSKGEITHLAVTVVLVIFIFGIFEGSCHFFSQFAGTNGPLQTSMHYMQGMQAEGKAILKGLIKQGIEEKISAAKFTGYFSFGIGGETAFQKSYHNAYSRQYEVLSDMVTVGMVSAGVQYYLLFFVQDFIFPVIIPFGLFLRAVPFAREAGNSVLAIAFALLVIFPFAYAVNSSVLDIPDSRMDYCDEDKEDVLGDCTSVLGWGRISAYLFQTIFLPNLAVVVTVTGASALMKAARVVP